MKPTLIVRGAGGGVFEIDDPREGDSQRDEVLREQIAKGDLVIVDPPAKARPNKAPSEA